MNQPRLVLAEHIASALQVQVFQVEAAICLLDDGATVPFIARYRKERTGGLDDTQLRYLAQRLHTLRELDLRRESILSCLREQEKLTPALEQQIRSAETKARLEDLYLPYRPKRRTKAHSAREAGLLPLAEQLLGDPLLDPLTCAEGFVNSEAGVADSRAALEGARQILIEQFGEDPDFIESMRKYLWETAVLHSQENPKKKEAGSKFSDYFKGTEPIKKIPSHRALALFRGRREGVLQLSLVPEDPQHGEKQMALWFHISSQGGAADSWLQETVRLSWKNRVFPKLELELLSRLRDSADEEAIRVFSRNLRGLLLAAPAGQKITLGLDPAIRTGVKAAVVDSTGKLLDYATVFPFAPLNEWYPALAVIAKLVAKHGVSLISIGNGTGSRDTQRLVSEMIKMYPDLPVTKCVVSEAGASVYSASELAAHEFPDLNVSIRGAVSIARRLQDPLAELVKIEPKAIGVGQYQHDVNQSRLAHCLEGVVEDCVNQVGVELNTASAPLLARVSGLNETLAKQIVAFRDIHGAFTAREQLLQVPRMGEKTFQQAAGFLRIRDAANPLDASGVHPEAYPLVEKMLHDKQISLTELLGNKALLTRIEASKYVEGAYGLPTVQDVLSELQKPGRDPRPDFKTALFKEGIEDITQLEKGLILEGIVSNVTNFGAFVNIGVHQDGLVHISAMTNRFIQDPHEIVKAGDIVKVKVIEVDTVRRRIGLSMKLDETPTIKPASSRRVAPDSRIKESAKPRVKEPHSQPPKTPKVSASRPPFNTAMADALSKLKQGFSS